MSEFAAAMAKSAMNAYRLNGERAALRCALSDAAHLCDALAAAAASANRRGRRVTNGGQVMVDCFKQAGDAIWAMRELIAVDDSQPPAMGADANAARMERIALGLEKLDDGHAEPRQS